MSRNTRVIDATPEQVWAVLADGWLYPMWVVGATRMRNVDDNWPAERSQLHHSAGVWPAALDDETEVIASDPPSELRLRASGWPLGKAEVAISLTPAESGTTVSIEERATEGPGALVPRVVHDPLITWRNTETLRRLAFIVEGRARG